MRTIDTFTSNFGFIGDGQCNYIAPGTSYNSILNGLCNSAAGNCSTIFGGCGNSDGGPTNALIAGSGITGVCANTLPIIK